jgi:hypothetical protein
MGSRGRCHVNKVQAQTLATKLRRRIHSHLPVHALVRREDGDSPPLQHILSNPTTIPTQPFSLIKIPRVESQNTRGYVPQNVGHPHRTYSTNPASSQRSAGMGTPLSRSSLMIPHPCRAMPLDAPVPPAVVAVCERGCQDGEQFPVVWVELIDIEWSDDSPQSRGFAAFSASF